MHPGYKFEIAPVVVAVGHASKCFITCLKMVGYKGKDIKLLICRMQVKSISGKC